LKWFKKIFQRNGREKEEIPSRLALNNLDKWLEERLRQPEFEEKVKGLYQEIEGVTTDLESDLKKLKSASPTEGAPPRLLKAGQASREKVRKQMGLLAQKLTPPRDENVDSAKVYHAGIVKHLENTVQKFGRAQSYMAHLFPEEAKAVNSDLGRLAQILAELDEAIKERDEDLFATRKADEITSRIRDERPEIDALQREILEDQRKLAELRNSIDATKKEIENNASSEEGLERAALKGRLKEMREELEEIEAEMAGLISPMGKGISRLVKQDSSDRLSLQHKETFEKLSCHPAQVLEEDLSGALQELKSKLDLLGLRKKMRDKTAEHLDRLLEEKPLEALKARHSQLNDNVHSIEQRWSESGSETKKLEEKLAQDLGRMENLDTRLDESEKKLRALKENIAQDETDLKEILEKIAGGPVEIDMSAP